MFRFRLQPPTLVLAFASIAVLSACAEDDVSIIYSGDSAGGRSYCDTLDDYFTACCVTCGSDSEYCTDPSFDMWGASEPWCERALSGVDTRWCACDAP